MFVLLFTIPVVQLEEPELEEGNEDEEDWAQDG
jgi:hypothetical protein